MLALHALALLLVAPQATAPLTREAEELAPLDELETLWREP